MAVQSQRASQRAKLSEPSSTQQSYQIRRNSTSVVRIDPRVDAPKSPHSPVQFREYVEWLSETGASETDNTEPMEAAVVETGWPDADVVAAESIDTDQADAVRRSESTREYVLTTNQLDSDLQGRVFRVDLRTENPAASDSESASIAIPTPHLDLKKFANQLSPESAVASTQHLPGFPDKTAQQLANWEVPDFRWPVGVERLIYQKPKLALLLLNQATRFIRPNANRLVVCGNGRHQGSSTIAIGLARWAAENSQRILLVDADLSSPSLGDQLGLNSGFDMSWSQIKSDNPLAEVLVESARTGVCFLPLQRKSAKSGSHAMLDQLGEIIDSIALQFDLIIIDCGTANQLMNSLSRHDRLADSLVLVHNRRQADPDLYLQTVARLNHFGIHNLVVAENFSGSTQQTGGNDS